MNILSIAGVVPSPSRKKTWSSLKGILLSWCPFFSVFLFSRFFEVLKYCLYINDLWIWIALWGRFEIIWTCGYISLIYVYILLLHVEIILYSTSCHQAFEAFNLVCHFFSQRIRLLKLLWWRVKKFMDFFVFFQDKDVGTTTGREWVLLGWSFWADI